MTYVGRGVDDGASPADAYAKLKTLDLFADATDV